MQRDEVGIAVRREGAVLRVHLDRPHRRNALDDRAFRCLAESFELAADEPALRVVALSAEGDHFCAGADLEASNAPRAERPRTGHMVRGLARGAHRAIRAMHECPLPIVAGVRGYAAGVGCNLALACDFVVASETARFVEPFVDRGLSPDSGSTWLLPRLVGLARARRMLLLGEPVSAQQAADWGLVHEAAPDRELDARTGSLVERLASAALSVGLAKSLLHRGLHIPLSDALDNEAYAEELAIRSLDFKEGLSAFREKRKPRFEGR
jgi:2-(1,2-epoxy-1,2-dihydrophenyl)acetyl-CoA isomerase